MSRRPRGPLPIYFLSFTLPRSRSRTVVIYEVNLTVEPEQSNEYSVWLEEHIRGMLELEGFDSAALYARSGPDEEARAPERVPEGKRHWTVHYHLENRAALERYFEEDAERMRAKGADQFEGQFSAERRVLESRKVFSHQER